jgi:transposase
LPPNGANPKPNVVERCFNRLKQFRGLATRFANGAAYHRAEIILA